MTRTGKLLLWSVIAVLGGGAIAGGYAYEGTHYVTTDYASVVTPVVVVSAPQAGTLTRWSLQPDQFVRAGTVVGTITTPTGRRLSVQSRMTGYVTVSYAAAGDSVTAGETLGEVGALSRSVIVGEIPETEAVHLRVGQRVDVRLPDDPSTIAGTLTHIGRAALVAVANGPGLAPLTTANATEYVPVTVQFPKGGLRVIDGMSATLRVHI